MNLLTASNKQQSTKLGRDKGVIQCSLAVNVLQTAYYPPLSSSRGGL